MDRNERTESPQQAILEAIRGERSDTWTALPGIVQSYDAAKKTCSVQPTVRVRIDSPSYNSPTMVKDPSGAYVWDQLPVLLDCPVYFPSGGGCTLTFPVAKGDECLVVFSSRCIDAWWQSGGIQNPPVTRMHDLSDGFVLVGVSSLPTVPCALSTVAAQLRTNDGTAYIEINSSTKDVGVHTPASYNATVGGNVTFNVTGNVTVNASGSGTLTASSWSVRGPATFTDNATFSANVTVNGFTALNGGFGATGGSGSYSVNGSITGLTDVVVGGKSIGPSHHHSGVTTGGGNSGGVV